VRRCPRCPQADGRARKNPSKSVKPVRNPTLVEVDPYLSWAVRWHGEGGWADPCRAAPPTPWNPLNQLNLNHFSSGTANRWVGDPGYRSPSVIDKRYTSEITVLKAILYLENSLTIIPAYDSIQKVPQRCGRDLSEER
jgi:hypothetical protein